MIMDNDADLNLGSAWNTERIEQATTGLQVSIEQAWRDLSEDLESNHQGTDGDWASNVQAL